MAWYFPQSGTTTLFLDDGNDAFVAQQVFLNAPVSANGSDGHDVVVAGTVANDYNSIALGTVTADANSVTVEATGQVRTFGGDSAIILRGFEQQVINHGLIAGAVAAIRLQAETTATSSSTVINTGTIDTQGAGIWHDLSAETLVVHNSGTIRSLNDSFYSSGTSKDEITNSGSMIGDVVLGDGDDLYDGRLGTIDGDVLGQAGKDRLYAGTGNDKLFGGDGNDTLMGGAGADYLSGGTGTDGAAYTSAKAGVTVSLANATLNTGDAKGDTFSSIENLTGSAFNDLVFGSNARNSINGYTGNDTIKGYAGNDTLTGGTGADIFVFNSGLNASTNVDTITDFNVAADTIQLDNAIFTALTTTGVLASAAFRANAIGLAADSSDRIIYETDTGELYYDFNGNAAGGGVLFAKIGLGLGLTSADFVVI